MSKRSRLAATAAMLAVGALALTGCAPESGSTPAPSASQTVPDPEFFEDGTAADNQPYFEKVLADYTAGDAEILGKPIVNALVEAGFDRDNMQVSFDRTKTDLDADNIFVSVRFDDSCLIGQVILADRSFVTEVADTVGPKKDLCLIGETREINW